MGLSKVSELQILHRCLLTFNDGIDWTTLLTEATVYAFCHIDVIPRRSPATILPLFCFNRDGLRWTYGFAKLASNTPLFSRWISPESMLASEPWRYWAFLEWIVNCVSVFLVNSCLVDVVDFLRWPEELFHQHPHTPDHFCQEEIIASSIHRALSVVFPCFFFR